MDYPRPQFRRKNWINLNGKWGFCESDTINVPFSPETELSGIHNEKLQKILVYQRNFNLEQFQGRMLLHFEGVDYFAQVFINEKFVGKHYGAYERFSFDITSYVNIGENTIKVITKDSTSLAQPRGKQRWKKESFECWYVQTSGIWKTVWMENVPEKFIKPIKMIPDYFNKSIIFKDTDDIEKAIYFNGKELIRTYDNIVNLSDNFYPWYPGNPNLYDVVFRNNSGDEVFSYFALRDISIKNNKIYLNGKEFFQKLILDQGYWQSSGLTPPNYDAIEQDIQKTLEMGFNGARKHMKIEDERYYYIADKMGLLVWAEMPAHYVFCKQSRINCTKEWKKIVKQLYNHPSIITWVPFNESWGLPQIRYDKSQQLFSKTIFNWTKKYDRSRPVITNDGWEHTVSDIVTIHDYEEKGSALLNKYLNIEKAVNQNILINDKNKRVFSKGYSYDGQPIMISEFGGISFECEGWGYGSAAKSEDELIERIQDLISSISKISHVCGYCYTQLTDVFQEMNGLLDFSHEYKVDPKKIETINNL